MGAFLAAGTLLLAACSTTPGTGGSSPTVVVSVKPSSNVGAQSCALLTQAETEAAFNQTFLPPSGTDGEPGHCQYFNSNGFGLQVDISRAPTVAADFDQARTDSGAGAKDVPGIGERAFEDLQGRRLLEFIKGPALVTLYSASRIDADVFRTLAETAASRLP